MGATSGGRRGYQPDFDRSRSVTSLSSQARRVNPVKGPPCYKTGGNPYVWALLWFDLR
jgi:hypothetical protein